MHACRHHICAALPCVPAGTSTLLGSVLQSTTVPDLRYEYYRLLSSYSAPRVFFQGCNLFIADNVAYYTPSSAQTVAYCPASHCSAAKSSANVSMICSNSNAGGDFDVYVLHQNSCEGGFCSAADSINHIAAAREKGAHHFVVTGGPNAQHLEIMDLDSSKVTIYSKAVSAPLRTFSHIYEHKVWGPAGGGSGIGSTMEHTTGVRSYLMDVFKKYSIATMVDAPCGSLAWMPEVVQRFPNISYTGLDVVCDLIKSHQHRFQRFHWRFYCADLCTQELPKVDLIFSRDAMQHVPFTCFKSFLANVRKSGSKYLMIGSYIKSTQPNRNIALGDYYDVDVMKPPFNFPKPLEIFAETYIPNEPQKHMLLYQTSDIPV